MKQKLHKELEKLLEFFLEQRRNPPAEYAYGKGIVERPEIFTVKDLQAHLVAATRVAGDVSRRQKDLAGAGL
jgi:hypothetical protein